MTQSPQREQEDAHGQDVEPLASHDPAQDDFPQRRNDPEFDHAPHRDAEFLRGDDHRCSTWTITRVRSTPTITVRKAISEPSGLLDEQHQRPRHQPEQNEDEGHYDRVLRRLEQIAARDSELCWEGPVNALRACSLLPSLATPPAHYRTILLPSGPRREAEHPFAVANTLSGTPPLERPVILR